MSAVDPNSIIEAPVLGRPYRVRSGAAQANVGQTDWIRVPAGAQFAHIYIDVTASAGTTPIFLPQIQALEPITLDDAHLVGIGGAMTGGITSTGQIIVHVGPGVSGIADATLAVSAAGGSKVEYNQVLPSILGIKTVLDRTTGDETYSYTITIEFR